MAINWATSRPGSPALDLARLPGNKRVNINHKRYYDAVQDAWHRIKFSFISQLRLAGEYYRWIKAMRWEAWQMCNLKLNSQERLENLVVYNKWAAEIAIEALGNTSNDQAIHLI